MNKYEGNVLYEKKEHMPALEVLGDIYCMGG
jgi:hypothetical protein